MSKPPKLTATQERFIDFVGTRVEPAETESTKLSNFRAGEYEIDPAEQVIRITKAKFASYVLHDDGIDIVTDRVVFYSPDEQGRDSVVIGYALERHPSWNMDCLITPESGFSQSVPDNVNHSIDSFEKLEAAGKVTPVGQQK